MLVLTRCLYYKKKHPYLYNLHINEQHDNVHINKYILINSLHVSINTYQEMYLLIKETLLL